MRSHWHDTRTLIMYENFVRARSHNVALQENVMFHFQTECNARHYSWFFSRAREWILHAARYAKDGRAARSDSRLSRLCFSHILEQTDTHISMPAPARRLSTTVNVNNRTHDHFAKRRGAVSHADQARRSRLGPATGPARLSIGPGGSAR